MGVGPTGETGEAKSLFERSGGTLTDEVLDLNAVRMPVELCLGPLPDEGNGPSNLHHPSCKVGL